MDENVMQSFNWGIIGPGNIAHDFAKDLKHVQYPRQKIYAVLSREKNSAAEFAREYDVPHYFATINEFIKLKKELDAVYIATPHTLHFEQALTCIKNGIPVLCEKPVTINAKQLRQLLHASAKYKCFLMEGMWVRLLPSIKRVSDLIKEKVIGNIISVNANMSYHAPYDPNSRYFNPALGGGSLLDLGIYPLFLATMVLGKPRVIKAIGKLSAKKIDESCAVLLQYKTGQYAMLESSLIAQTDLTATIYGEKGTIKIPAPWNEKPTSIQVSFYNGTKADYPCHWEGHGFQYEIEEVVHCVMKNKTESALLNHQLSMDIMDTMDRIRKQIHVTYKKYE
jgi:predicted dehydrogenase